MKTWNSGWQQTQWRGVYVSGDAVRIRARVVDPRSGRMREVNRILSHLAPEDAVEERRKLQEELRGRLHDPPKQNVIEFGRYWLGVKRAIVDAGTYARYEDALENHAFERLGRLNFRELRSIYVQDWINRELASGYRVATVKGWFRVFRTMTQDAIDCLGVAADPTRRVRFPVGDERRERNSLLPDELARFLAAMERLHPRHYALTATLALTGLRFCHASALRWEDLDEKTGILRIERRQLRSYRAPDSS
jgi:integrase